MPKLPSTKRRKAEQPAEDNIPESIFDALNAHSPSGEAEKAEAKGPTIADLQKQMADMEKTYQTRLDAADRANAALSTAAPALRSEPKEPTFSTDGLPDPLDASYAPALAKRVAEYNQQMTGYQTEKSKAAAPVGDFDSLWEDFTTTYPAYAADKEGLEFAAQKVAKTITRKGLDGNRYMFQNSDRFFRDIVKAYDDRFGKPDDDGEELSAEIEAPIHRKRAKSQVTEDDADEGRTQGIFGGIDSGNGGRPKPPPKGDMIKDLQDVQRKTGYY